jgi:hypothetical protein
VFELLDERNQVYNVCTYTISFNFYRYSCVLIFIFIVNKTLLFFRVRLYTDGCGWFRPAVRGLQVERRWSVQRTDITVNRALTVFIFFSSSPNRCRIRYRRYKTVGSSATAVSRYCENGCGNELFLVHGSTTLSSSLSFYFSRTLGSRSDKRLKWTARKALCLCYVIY